MTKSNLIQRAALLMALALLTACAAVGPDYRPPATQLPGTWHNALAAGPTGEPAALTAWWSTFNDPPLADLIGRAVDNNPDLRQAQARLREARARRGVADANRFPALGVRAAASHARSSEESGSGNSAELYSAGFDASWEPDVFGGKQRALEAADASLQAAQEDLRDVLVSLTAEVALNYVEVRSFQARLAIAQANLAAQSETFDLAHWRREAGLTTQLDEEQARLGLEQTRAQLPALQTGLEQARNRLALLLGQQPGTLPPALSAPAAIPVAPLEIAVGVPADLLRRRPDIRRAERQLAAQTAQVGAATAARYPNFSLLGSIGLEALSASNLFLSSALKSSLGASAGVTLFDAGRIRQNIAVQDALQEQALLRYEATVLTALGDVENALVAFTQEQRRRQSLAQAAQAARNAVQLARDQYTAGMVDFQVVLDTQRSLLSLQDQLAASDAEVSANAIRLYKALGGGWTTPAVAALEIHTPEALP